MESADDRNPTEGAVHRYSFVQSTLLHCSFRVEEEDKDVLVGERDALSLIIQGNEGWASGLLNVRDGITRSVWIRRAELERLLREGIVKHDAPR